MGDPIDKFHIHISLHVRSHCPPIHTLQTKESDQGSYSRVLDDTDRVHEVQQKWRDEKNSWFTLCRSPTVVQEDSLLGSPTSPISLLSPTDEDNTYVVLVEEGCGSSPTFSDLMSDSYFSTTASESSRVSPVRTNPSGSNTAENSPNEVTGISTGVKLDSDGSQNVVNDAVGILLDEMSSRSSLRTTSTSTEMSGCGLFGSHDDCRSPDSPLNSSLYTCSTESMTHSDPFDNSLDNRTASSVAFSRASCLIHRRFSSPESYSFQRDTRMAVKKTRARVHFDDQVLSHGTASTNSITSPWHNTSVATETGTNHVALHSKRRHFSDSGSPVGQKKSQGRGLKLSLLMQKSIDEGMTGMMNRVVNEQRQRRRSWANTEAEPQGGPRLRVATSLVFKDGVVFQPLVCSPVHSEERKYPQLVSPAVREGETGRREDGERDRDEDGGQARKSSALDKCTGNGVGARRLALDGSRLAAENATEEQLKGVAKHQAGVGREGEPSTGVGHESPGMGSGGGEDTPEEGGGSSPHPQPDAATVHGQREEIRPSHQQCSHMELPYNYHRTWKTIPPLLVESELTIHPTFQTRASLYPSFLHSDYFSSEMDLLESLSTLMDIKLAHSKPKPCKRGQTFSTEKQTLSEIDSLALSPRRRPLVPDHKGPPSLLVPPHVSLISPSRRSRLINQAARAIYLRRPHSFSVRQDHPTAHDEPSSVVSPARRDCLIQKAALLQSKYQASKQSQLGEESHRGLPAGRTDSEPLPTTTPQLDGELQREVQSLDGGDPERSTISPQLTPGVPNGRPSNPHFLSLRPPTTSSYNTSMRPHSSQPPSRPSSAVYSDTHGDLTVNLHRRQSSYPDSVGDLSSSLETRRSRSATPSWSHGSVETIATVPSKLLPSRRLSNSHTPLNALSRQESLPSLANHSLPHNACTHPSQKSLSYLSVLQQATRKQYSTESANTRLQENRTGFHSVEVLNTGTQREILYTFGPQKRPVTVVVSNSATSKSTLSLSNPQSLPRHLKRTMAHVQGRTYILNSTLPNT